MSLLSIFCSFGNERLLRSIPIPIPIPAESVFQYQYQYQYLEIWIFNTNTNTNTGQNTNTSIPIPGIVCVWLLPSRFYTACHHLRIFFLSRKCLIVGLVLFPCENQGGNNRLAAGESSSIWNRRSRGDHLSSYEWQKLCNKVTSTYFYHLARLPVGMHGELHTAVKYWGLFTSSVHNSNCRT